MRGKHILFCKNVLLYTINNHFVVLKIIISSFSYMSRNTFPEPQPQPDSASYVEVYQFV